MTRLIPDTCRVDLTDRHLERLNISRETGYDKPSGYVPPLFEEIGQPEALFPTDWDF